MLYNESLLDLDAHGILGLTLDAGSSHYTPLPAQRFGYAAWLPKGAKEGQDRLGLVTRRVDPTELRASAEFLRHKFDGAAAWLQGMIHWTLEQVSEDFVECPNHAVSMGDGLVLLLFESQVRVPELRVVDVPANKVLLEIATPELRQQIRIELPSYARMFNDEREDPPRLHSAGNGYLNIRFYGEEAILRWTGSGFERAQVAAPPPLADGAFSANHYFCRDRKLQALKCISLTSGREPIDIPFRHGRSGYAALSCGRAVDRCGIGHEGGTIEVVDADGREVAALRPLPHLGRKEQVITSMSALGRYMLVSHWIDTVVVDVDHGLVADAQLPSPVIENEPGQFEVRYRPASLLTDQALFSVHKQSLRITPLGRLEWTEALKPGTARKPARAGKARFHGLLQKWRKPAVSLKPARSPRGRSKIYGKPDLPPGHPWPEHDGRRMLLLCQVELKSATRLLGDGFPSEGALLFFVTVDDENELMIDDSFNPVATRVLWVPELSSGPQPDGPAVDAVPVKLQKVETDLPEADAPIVLTELLTEEEREEYRTYMEARQPDGPVPGHRLGGYPANVQSNSLEAQAEEQANGDIPDESSEGWATAAKWRLLLQLDSDDVFMWGTDMGMLYFMIHEEDLARRDFSRVVALAEGY